jgi:hypothetical protein
MRILLIGFTGFIGVRRRMSAFEQEHWPRMNAKCANFRR